MLAGRKEGGENGQPTAIRWGLRPYWEMFGSVPKTFVPD
jgi:hypothetical protein